MVYVSLPNVKVQGHQRSLKLFTFCFNEIQYPVISTIFLVTAVKPQILVYCGSEVLHLGLEILPEVKGQA